MGIGISKLSTYIPDNRELVEDVIEKVGGGRSESKLLTRVLGLKQVPVVEHSQKLEDTLSMSLKELLENEFKDDIKLVLYAHTLIPQVPHNYQLLHKVLNRYGLAHVGSYGISHMNCASFFKALEVAELYLEKCQEKSKVLVLSGDQTNFISQARYLPKSSVIGDASSAMLVSNYSDINRIISTGTLTDTRFYNGIYAQERELKNFNRSYTDNLNKLINNVLEKSKRKLEEVDWIIPHNVNKTTWENFSKSRGFNYENILTDQIEEIGHTYCTDAQLNYDYGVKKNKINSGDLCLWIGVGLGSYYGACLIQA